MKAVPRDTRTYESIEPALLGRVKRRFYQHLEAEDQALADEMILEGWLFRGWLGMLVPIAWPPPPETEIIVSVLAEPLTSEGSPS